MSTKGKRNMNSDWLPDDPTLDLQHLQSELARLDNRLRRQMLLWERAGQDAADPYRGLYVTAETASSLLARPLGGHWGATAPLSAEEEAVFAQAVEAARRRSRELVDKARSCGRCLRLERLQTAFGLDEVEMDILLLGLAPAVDLRYEKVFAFLQDDITRKLPSISLALDLLAPPGMERLLLLRRFDDSAPLLRHGLLRRIGEEGSGSSLPAAAFLCEESVVAWLSGSYRLPAAQASYLRLLPGADLSAKVLLLDGGLRATLKAALVAATQGTIQGATQMPLVVLEGPDTLAQMAAAQWLACTAGKALLIFDADAAQQAGQPPLHALPLVLRDALLLDAAIYLQGGDALADDRALSPALAGLLDRHAGLMIVGAGEPWLWQGAGRAKRVLRFAFPVPAAPVRIALWRHFLAQCGDGDAKAALPEVETVANRFALTSAQVRDAAATALDLAAQAGEPLAEPHLQAAARAQSAANFHGLARKVESHRAWNDLVLPADCLQQMREICDRIKYRRLVHEDWGFGRRLALNKGLNVLFAGVSGTGKTMSASVIAQELGLDLYKIDLSNVVSKYIGETEKSLARIFAEAETSNAILFFDEADALFGKRSAVQDAHDRYANVETSYLLQRMEEYDGLAILATNFRQNMDDAFVRRLHYIVEFPMPGIAERRRIWEQIWPQSAVCGSKLDLQFLAERMEISGGVIRNAALTAAFLAAANGGEITMKHVIGALQREFTKMGRILFESERGSTHPKLAAETDWAR